MESKEIIELINKLAFFKEFNSEEKAQVADYTENFIFHREEEFIVQQNSNDPSLYILLEGEVELRKNEEPDVIICTLLPGSIFGTIPALRISPSSKNVITKRKSLVLRLNRPMLDALNPGVINKFNVEFLKVLFRRISEMNITVARERGEILRITHTYGIIKEALDKTPSLSEETRITSNLMYEQLKNIQSLTDKR